MREKRAGSRASRARRTPVDMTFDPRKHVRTYTSKKRAPPTHKILRLDCMQRAACEERDGVDEVSPSAVAARLRVESGDGVRDGRPAHGVLSAS